MLFDLSQYRVERCPKCRSKEIQRSRRKSILDFALGFVLRPWRCTICFTRFYRPRWMKAVPRRVDLLKQGSTAKAMAANSSPGDQSVSSREQTAPGIV
jgi:hypothetical protein